MEKIKRPPPSGPHWAEMGESLDICVQRLILPPQGPSQHACCLPANLGIPPSNQAH